MGEGGDCGLGEVMEEVREEVEVEAELNEVADGDTGDSL